MTQQKRILVVDDDEKVLSSVAETLADAGYAVIKVNSSEEAATHLAGGEFDVAIVDIWMPGEDGISLLKRFGAISQPIIIMSGHANISTAVAATRHGAFDVIEKPFEKQALLRSISNAVVSKDQKKTEITDATECPNSESVKRNLNIDCIKSNFIKSSTGRSTNQRTIKKGAVLYGQGLHSGVRSGLTFEPLPVNSGIHFVGVASSYPAPAHYSSVTTTGFATSLKREDTEVSTVEHLMAAFWAYGITNILVKCNKEVPVFDGSSLEFCSLFDEVGILEQDAKIYEAVPDRVIRYERGAEWIQIEPSDKLTVSYELRYPEPLGIQKVSYDFDSSAGSIDQELRKNLFKNEIAPCRTFGFLKDLGALQSRGLALGGRFDNCVLIGEKGPLNTEFRFSDEPARHKVLDMIGDLYLAGRPIRGKITACMTGHADNVGVLKEWGV